MLENELNAQPTAEELGAAIGEGVEQQQQEPEVSLRDTILANVKEVQERPRDEQTGRFKAAEPKPQAQEEPRNEQQPAKQQAEPDKGSQSAPAAAQPPTSWSAEAKAEFGKLPRAVQDAISKREAEVHRGFTAQDEDRNFGKQLREVAAPYMPIIQAEGGTPASAFQTLLNSAYILRQGSQEQKIALVNDLITRYKIPLNGIAASPPDPQANPQPQQLHQGLTEEQVRQIAAETQYNAQLDGMIVAFAADPANVHFQKVRPIMSALLKAEAATSLKDAYDQACRAHPEISSSLEAERMRKAEEQRQADIRQKATAAKHAGGSVTGGPGATTIPQKTSQPNRSLREELEANLALVTQPRI